MSNRSYEYGRNSEQGVRFQGGATTGEVRTPLSNAQMGYGTIIQFRSPKTEGKVVDLRELYSIIWNPVTHGKGGVKSERTRGFERQRKATLWGRGSHRLTKLLNGKTRTGENDVREGSEPEEDWLRDRGGGGVDLQ